MTSSLQFVQLTQKAPLTLPIACRPVSGRSIVEEFHSCLRLGRSIVPAVWEAADWTSLSNDIETTRHPTCCVGCVTYRGNCLERLKHADISVCPEADVWVLTWNTVVSISTLQHHSLLVKKAMHKLLEVTGRTEANLCCQDTTCIFHRSLTLSLQMSYIYGAHCKARNFNVVYIWT
jgi:hypothetical protein